MVRLIFGFLQAPSWTAWWEETKLAGKESGAWQPGSNSYQLWATASCFNTMTHLFLRRLIGSLSTTETLRSWWEPQMPDDSFIESHFISWGGPHIDTRWDKFQSGEGRGASSAARFVYTSLCELEFFFFTIVYLGRWVRCVWNLALDNCAKNMLLSPVPRERSVRWSCIR